MKKHDTHRNFYKKFQTLPVRSTVNGRTGHNMSCNKADEYLRLIWYINHGEINPFGYIPVILRFHKNLKRRKTWIRLYKEENFNKAT